MNGTKFNWCGYEWIMKERWGISHPEKPWAIYSNDCVSIDNEDNLILTIKNTKQRDVFYTGLVSTTRNNPVFKYGEYTWIAKMPIGKNLWPALWMWSWDSWPPEIDIVEGWTNNIGGYFKVSNKKPLLRWNIQSNIHIKDGNNIQRDFPEFWNWSIMSKNPYKDFIEYTMKWYKDRVEFYYDKILVRTVKDNAIMDYINSVSGMNIIMDIYPTARYKTNQIKSPLYIKKFEYIPYIYNHQQQRSFSSVG